MASSSTRTLAQRVHTINQGSYLCQANTKLFLHLMLSTDTYLENTPKPADDPEEGENLGCDQIGAGQCGTVWNIKGTNQVIKMVTSDKKESLWNDCCMHKHIEEVFERMPPSIRGSINIPRFGAWVNPSNRPFWSDFGDNCAGTTGRDWGLLSTRIGPVPSPVCEGLLKEFGTKSKKFTESILAQRENQACLIRLYLGRRLERDPYQKFKLRDFDLMINEMEALELDTDIYAIVMAKTLAVLHWGAKVDAAGVEFVIGQAPQYKKPVSYKQLQVLGPDHPVFADHHSLDLRQHSLAIWLLDFDQCKPFQHCSCASAESDECVQQLKDAFFGGEPYYPHPGSSHPNDVALWHVFRDVYLQVSATLTENELPQRFIEAIDVEGKRRADGFRY